MQVRMLVNVTGMFYNMEPGPDMCSIHRGDLLECEPEQALRLIGSGQAELRTTGEVGRPWQKATPEEMVSLRSKLKIPAKPLPLSRAEQARQGL
jgi:hypothetical protein